MKLFLLLYYYTNVYAPYAAVETIVNLASVDKLYHSYSCYFLSFKTATLDI